METRELLEQFTARGHRNVQACHKTTLEFTKESTVTLRGDCVLGVSASISPVEFKEETKSLLQSARDFVVEIRVADLFDEFRGKGNAGLSLDNDREMVFRKSNFISGRTVLVACTKAASDLDGRIRLAAMQDDRQIRVSLYLID
ncbi:MAG TPA: DUF371 domain-containing protein [Candidatus Lokiarchaeia archaeon]|nr:DUF371 domain-containing protein [Candidatus Lokiarchaeia archaeon]